MNGFDINALTPHLDEIGGNSIANLWATLFLIIAVLLLRAAIHRFLVRNPKSSAETRRHRIVLTRNLLFVLTAFGLAVIWASEIRSLALSLVAVAVALVIATKELILCVAGTFVKAWSRAFSLGDRIEVGDTRGDVIDQGLFTTTVLEIGPQHLTHQYTGRSILIPNSRFLSVEVINESFTDDYVLHVFAIPIRRNEDWKLAGEILLKACANVCRPYEQEAEKHMLRLHREMGLQPPSLAPRVHFKVQDRQTLSLVVRVVTPARQKGRIEQQIMRAFLTEFPTKDEKQSD